MPQITERLRQAGLRATAPRRALLQALETDRTHPTAEQLHAKLRVVHPSISLSTVYDGLEALIRSGLCRRVATGEGVLRVDGRTDEHDHAVCRACGAIFDVDADLFPRPGAPSDLPGGLRVEGLRVEYQVTCTRCGAAETNGSGGGTSDGPTS